MKKAILILTLLLIGLFLFGCTQDSGYNLAESTDLNRSDFVHDLSESQTKEQYFGNKYWHTVTILDYNSNEFAAKGLENIINTYSPTQITLNGYAIRVKEFPQVSETGEIKSDGTTGALYFYQSGNQIITIDSTIEKGKLFAEWYFTKHTPN